MDERGHGVVAEGWFPVAHLLRPQGRRGEFLAEPLTSLEVLLPGRQYALRAAVTPEAAPGSRAAQGTDAILENCWWPVGRNLGKAVLKLLGVDSISAAEALAGSVLLLREADLPALDDGTFFARDLIGCTLLDHGQPVGTVLEMQFPVGTDGRTRLQDAPDLLVVDPLAREGGTGRPEAVLVPFVKAWLTNVDLAGKRLEMNLPAGLFEAEDTGSAPNPGAG